MKNLIVILVVAIFPALISAQDMKGMNHSKKETKKEVQSPTFTCVMHPEIHATKPGNCPKCGMVLVKEKAKVVKKTVVKENKSSKTPMTKTSKKEDNMDNMKMNGTAVSKGHDMGKMDMPKSNLGPIKTVVNKIAPRTVRYDLYVRDTIVNFTGTPKRAIAVNGQIPMPTLTFTEGDIADIHVYNELNEDTSLHWHGLFLPNQYDGVPNLTQMPIKPGTEHVYTFPIIQHGTHWYHSHTGLQEQIGMYGSMILNKREDLDIPTIPIILSEWTDVNPDNVNRMLRNATDWFAIQKGTTQSYSEAIKAGHFKTKVKNEWKRMNAMDVSDIYYDKFLINGKNEIEIKDKNQIPVSSLEVVRRTDEVQFKSGDKVRLRISNGGASTYFWLTYAGGKITVIASDGNTVEPIDVDRLLIAVSETYDVIVTIPDDKTAYEFLVTSEDRTKSASLYLGNGIKQLVAPLPKLKYFEGMKMMNGMMKMNGDLDDMGMQMSLNQMDMNVVMYPEITGPIIPKGEMQMEVEMNHSSHDMGNMKMDDSAPKKDKMKMTEDDYNSNALSEITTLNYAMLKSPTKTTLPKDAPVKELKFELSGNMNRYVWSLDNKVVSEVDKILIKKGENIRLILHNNSMMRHPMHLHGHDFRVINGQGEYAPMKNIIDIMPMERDTLEFAATESGDWFFHCHVLYHMMSGMGRVFSYENSPPNPEIPNPKLAQRKLFADDRKFHLMAENDFATNGNDGEVMLSNTRWSIGTEWRLGYKDSHGYETETHIGRYIGKMQWLMPFIGFDWRYRKMEDGEIEKNIFGQESTKNKRATVSLGFDYTLPMLVKFQTEVFSDGKVRLQLIRNDIPISPRLRMNLMVNSDKEYMGGFRYIIERNFGITTHYDSDMGLGFGLNLNY